MVKYDLVILGSGPAGFSAASKALDYGKHVCIIEAGNVGGAGIMHGALTSKTMWELSADYSVAGKVSRGYRASGLSVSYKEVKKSIIHAAKDRQYQMLSQIETFSRKEGQSGSLTIKYGYGKFVDSNTVEVKKENGEKESIHGDYFLIATGSRPRELQDIPVDNKYIFNSDTILDLDEFPERLLIIGSGVIGCEYATIFSNFKQTEVHLLDRTNRVIPFEDDDISDFVSESLQHNGVNIHFEAQLRTIIKKENYLEVVLDYTDGHSKVIEVDAALISIGRVPNTQNLGLEKIGLEPKNNGMIGTDDYCDIKSFGKGCNIFAAGDITGHGQLYNIAQVQGRHAADKMFGNETDELDYKNMSTLMFFRPEVAAVGMNEKQLRGKKIAYKAAVYSNKLVSRTIAMLNTRGFVKIIVSDDGHDRILGMRAVSPQASAFIISVAHLIGEKNGLAQVSKTVHPHPGVTEGIDECLRLFNGSSVFKKEAFPEYIKYYCWEPGTPKS